MRAIAAQDGSALVEAAILFPCLLLVLFWSMALTEVLVLKLKASEAARFALWETTVWKSPARIHRQVQQRFADLRSPDRIENAWTGLLAFPRAAAMQWSADVDASVEVKLAGNRSEMAALPGISGSFVERVSGWMAGAVQSAMRAERFDTHGAAAVRVRVRASRDRSRLLAGGDLVGHRGGDDLGAPRSLASLALRVPLGDERPMQLVFDTWKAWPKPAQFQLAGAPTSLTISPRQTYPEVEKQVAAQVDKIAFFGMRQLPWFRALESVTERVLGSGVGGTLLGGRPPSMFATGRMDSRDRGPITIRPMQPPEAVFVPNACEVPSGGEAPCTERRYGVARVGDVQSNHVASLGGLSAYTENEDVTRHTVPFRINSRYWRWSGGTLDGWSGGTLDALEGGVVPLPQSIARDNAYVRAWSCRGYFFSGATEPQVAHAPRRYRLPC